MMGYQADSNFMALLFKCDDRHVFYQGFDAVKGRSQVHW